jgi:ABC-type lipoprotein export system ATPase subunit
MQDVKLTVKNYRCFDDTHPLVVEMGSDFTALVGPNNSGKSSFLKFFFEHRSLWSNLRDIELLLRVPNRAAATLLEVRDPEEIFSHSNNRDLIVEIELMGRPNSESPHPEIGRVTCSCPRTPPLSWRFQFYLKGSTSPISWAVPQWIEKFRFIRNNPSQATYDVSRICDTAHVFASALYIGSFRNAINEGAGQYYDLHVGTSFITTWDSWKTGDSKVQNRATEAVTDDIRQIFEYERLEINASQDKRSLAIVANRIPYRLAELGAGLSQFIIVLGNAAIRRPRMILIDEPELNLHPTLQSDFLTSLASYATDAIVFATHSIGLARSNASRIYSFQNKYGSSIVKPFEQTPNYAEFVGEMSFSSFKELGCDRVLLVEGVSDVKVIQQFLRMLRKDHKIVILPLGGSQLIRAGVESELYELTRISSRIATLIDSERTSAEADPPESRRDFAKGCKKLGMDVCLTKRRATENYFSEKAIKKAFGDGLAALGPYDSLKDNPNGWRKSDNWRIAREMEFSEIEETDLGEFLLAL